MLLAKRRASRFSHCTGSGGYSKPTPGPLILKLVKMVLILIRSAEGCLEVVITDDGRWIQKARYSMIKGRGGEPHIYPVLQAELPRSPKMPRSGGFPWHFGCGVRPFEFLSPRSATKVC